MIAHEIHKISIISAEKQLESLLTDIYSHIRENAELGYFFALYSNLKEQDENGNSRMLPISDMETIVEVLRSNGFKVVPVTLPYYALINSETPILNLPITTNFKAEIVTDFDRYDYQNLYFKISWYSGTPTNLKPQSGE